MIEKVAASEPYSEAKHQGAPERKRGTAAETIAKGASWSLLGQVSPMIVTVFLTPYILHGLGITRYGLFVLTGSLVSFLGTFDGGIKGTAQRYFAVYAGEEDVGKATRLLCSLLLVIAVAGGIISTIGWFVSGPVIALIGVPRHFQPESVFLFRTLGILITFLLFHSLFVSVLQARGRYDYIVKLSLVVYVVWTVGLIFTVHFGWGLWGIAAVFMVQQLFLALVIIPGSLRYLKGGRRGLLSRTEIRGFFRFSMRVQLSNISTLINMEFDTVIIGAVVSARAVSFYNAGANFAENVGSIPAAMLAPAQTVMANTFGRDGKDATFQQFKRLQNVWVIGMSGWFAAASGAAYFAVVVWLGSEFRVAGAIAVLTLSTWATSLFGGIFRTYLTVIGEPGLEMRYGICSVIANVVLTIPFLFFGPIGVAAATGIGQVFGMLYLLRIARRRIDADVPNPLKSIPLLATAVTAAVVVGLELLLYRSVPGGGAGLLICALPALVGLAVFMSVVVGPLHFIQFGRAFVHRVRATGYRAATTELVEQLGR